VERYGCNARSLRGGQKKKTATTGDFVRGNRRHDQQGTTRSCKEPRRKKKKRKRRKAPLEAILKARRDATVNRQKGYKTKMIGGKKQKPFGEEKGKQDRFRGGAFLRVNLRPQTPWGGGGKVTKAALTETPESKGQ